MEIVKTKTLCFIGQRAEKLPQTTEGLEELQAAICEEIDRAINDGFDTFLTGARLGFDLLAADMVRYRVRVVNPGDPSHIKLIAMLAFEVQANRWSEPERELFFNTLTLCDEVITLYPHYKTAVTASVQTDLSRTAAGSAFMAAAQGTP